MPLICYWRVDIKQKKKVRNNHVGELLWLKEHNIIKNSPLNTTTKAARNSVEEALVPFHISGPTGEQSLSHILSQSFSLASLQRKQEVISHSQHDILLFSLTSLLSKGQPVLIQLSTPTQIEAI